MSDLSDIVEGAATVVKAISGLNVYDHSPMGVHDPAAFVVIDETDYRVTMGDNTLSGTLKVVVGVASRGKTVSSQKTLYDYVSPTGARSIVKKLRDDPTLNGAVDDSDVETVEDFRRDEMEGGVWESADIMVSFMKTIA